jgi:phage terminase large subunit
VVARRYVIVEDRTGRAGPVFRGAARSLWKDKGPEVVIAGPAETGKTFAALHKLDGLLWKYAGAQAVLVRKVRDTIHPTALQTYVKKVLPPGSPVAAYGGEKPQWFDYPNGSRLWLAGIDDPGKALSSERDFIFVNQAEELSADDWQVLTTRATGRAGHAACGQVIGDCNPGPPHHWIKNRPSLKVLESRHEDNPTLWDARRREWTEQGRRTLAVLAALTGVRRERLFKGKWVGAEGTVYEFDEAVHLVERFDPPAAWRRFRSIDFGFTNPFVCQWWALDSDGRMYLYREVYRTRRTVAAHARQIKALSAGERIDATVADHDAEDRATLAENGIPTVAARKELSPGIQAVEERLKPQGVRKPRLFVMRNALVERDDALTEAKKPVCTEQEFNAYVWSEGRTVSRSRRRR